MLREVVVTLIVISLTVIAIAHLTHWIAWKRRNKQDDKSD